MTALLGAVPVSRVARHDLRRDALRLAAADLAVRRIQSRRVEVLREGQGLASMRVCGDNLLGGEWETRQSEGQGTELCLTTTLAYVEHCTRNLKTLRRQGFVEARAAHLIPGGVHAKLSLVQFELIPAGLKGGARLQLLQRLLAGRRLPSLQRPLPAAPPAPAPICMALQRSSGTSAGVCGDRMRAGQA